MRGDLRGGGLSRNFLLFAEHARMEPGGVGSGIEEGVMGE